MQPPARLRLHAIRGQIQPAQEVALGNAVAPQRGTVVIIKARKIDTGDGNSAGIGAVEPGNQV